MGRALGIALRSLGREWRSGELAVLLVSLTVAVAALSGVGFLVDRIDHAVQAQAREVLAADLRIEASRPLQATEEPEAKRLGLSTATVTQLLSVVFNGDASQLASVRAVSSAYPLLGTLQVADQPFGAAHPIRQLPQPGEAWADSRLAAAIGARVGSPLTVGASTLRLSKILISRPDQGSAFVDFAAALLINATDLPATQLLQPTSRVRYALLLAGPRPALDEFRDWYQAQSPPGERLMDVTDASPQIGDAARRSGRFLALASLVAVLLCAVAVALGARSYLRRHLDAVALMKTLGASRRMVLGVTLLQLVALALVATLIGSLTGWLTEQWLISVLRGWLRSDLPPAGIRPALVGLTVAVAMLAGFALPSLLQLTRVPALRVLRHDAGPPTPGLWAAFAPAALALMAVIYGTLGEWRLSLWFTGGLAGAVLLLAIGGGLLVRLAGRVRSGSGLSWRYGLASLARRRAESVTQIVAFGLGVLLLLVLSIVQRDLVSDWRASLPVNAPNYFFLNIPAAERDEFSHRLSSQGAKLERLLPMIRGRLAEVNGEPIEARSRTLPGRGGTTRDDSGRELNLSWSGELGDDNRIVEGRWFSAQDQGKALVSIATEYQQTLKLKLGDELVFDIAGERVAVRIASFRQVKWDSFKPNFFIMFAPGLLDVMAGTYMTSAYFEPTSASALADLAHQFPGVSIFNVGELLAQVRTVIDKAIVAVQSVFVFTLLAGLTVLLAAVQASRDERRHETAVLRVLGAGRGMILRAVITEFSALGALAGVLAASGAAVGGFWLARELGLKYRFDALIWIAGVSGTLALVGFAGWVAARSVINHPPRAALN